jgi:HAD superfamily hydrolase (TIGR01509 family)
MNQIELEGVVHSKPMKNAKETLMKLKERGLGIGIATRGCREYAAESMKLTGLDSYVNYCLARDEVPHPKPDPRHLLDVVNLLGVEPNSVFYVGDTPTDLDTAKAAGIRFVGYKRNEEWGKRLIDAGCSKMVEDLLELVNMAENF